MATYTIDEIAIIRTAANINDADVFELQIKDGSGDDLKSAKITKAELMKAFNDGSTPLRYKALISQNAPIATTQTPSILAGQIWEDTIGTADAGDLVVLGSYELISGTLGAVNAKYRSAANNVPIFMTASLAYDGSPFIVSTNQNGDISPFINTTGANPIFEYGSSSKFYVTLTGLLKADKTIAKIGNSDISGTNLMVVYTEDDDDRVTIKAASGTLYYTPFELEIYP